MENSTEILDIAIGLVFQKGKLLICLRKPDAHLGSLWEFPGGKVDPNEDLEAAVIREVAEEVGLKIAVDRLFHTEVAHYPERTVRLHFFLGELLNDGRAAQPLAASRLAWVFPRDLDGYAFPSGNQSILEKLKNFAKE